MKTSTILLSTVVVVIALGLAGCKKKSEPHHQHEATAPAEATPSAEPNAAGAAATRAAGQVEQTMCPVMEMKIDKNVFVEYKGKKVYFCCADCKAKFEADPEKYIAKLPQFQKQ